MSGRGQSIRANRFGVQGHEHNILGQWTDWVPTIAQGTSTNIAKTITWAKYKVVDEMVYVRGRFVITGSGVTNNPVTISVPEDVSTTGLIVGTGAFCDATQGTNPYVYVPMSVITYSTTTLSLMKVSDTTSGVLGTDPAVPMSVNDLIIIDAFYPRDV